MGRDGRGAAWATQAAAAACGAEQPTPCLLFHHVPPHPHPHPIHHPPRPPTHAHLKARAVRLRVLGLLRGDGVRQPRGRLRLAPPHTVAEAAACKAAQRLGWGRGGQGWARVWCWTGQFRRWRASLGLALQQHTLPWDQPPTPAPHPSINSSSAVRTTRPVASYSRRLPSSDSTSYACTRARNASGSPPLSGCALVARLR